MTDLDAMDYNGTTHNGDATDSPSKQQGDEDEPTIPGDDDLWTQLA